MTQYFSLLFNRIELLKLSLATYLKNLLFWTDSINEGVKEILGLLQEWSLDFFTVLLRHKTECLLISSFILSFCAILFVFLAIFRLVKYFKFYSRSFSASFIAFKLLVKNLFNKGYLKQQFSTLKKEITMLIVSMLFYGWNKLEHYQIIADPFLFGSQIRHKINSFEPLNKFVLFIKQRLTNNWALAFFDKQLFDSPPKTADRLNIEQDILNELAKIKSGDDVSEFFLQDAWIKELDNFLNDAKTNSLLIIGNKGCGKTVLLTYLHQNYKNSDFIELRNYNSREEKFDNLTRLVENKATKYIFIDGFETLLARKISGYDYFRKFVALVQQNPAKYFVIAINPVFYAYIQKIFDIQSLFKNRFLLSRIDEDYLLDFFNQKLKKMGYIYKMYPDKKTRREIQHHLKHKIISEKEVLDHIKKSYFRQLVNYARDNLKFHQEFFLRSITRVQNQTLYLNMESIIFDTAFTKSMSQNHLLIYYSLILHRELSLDDLYDTVLIPKPALELTLFSQVQNGYINKNDQLYSINYYFYPAIYKILQEKKLI